MHTMSDQIGDNDDFDRDSRTQQYQNDIMRSRIKKRIEEESKLNDGNYEDTVSEASFNDQQIANFPEAEYQQMQTEINDKGGNWRGAKDINQIDLE